MPTNPLPPPPPFTTAPSKRGPIKFARSMDEILDPMKQTVNMGLPPQGIEPQAPAIPPPHFMTPPGMQPMENPMYSIDDLVEEPLTTRPIFPAKFGTGAQVLSQTEMNPTDPEPLRKTYGEEMPFATGIMEGFSDILDFLNTPTGVGVTVGLGAAFGGAGQATTIGRTAAKTGLPDGIIKGLLKMGFTTSGIKGLTDSVPQMKEAFERGDTQEGARQLFHTLANAGMVLPGATITEPQLTPNMPARFTDIGKKILNDESGYLSLEFIHNKRQVARQDYGGAIARYSTGMERPLPADARANIVVRSEPTGAPGEEVGAAVRLANEAGIPPERINYYYERSPGKRIRLSQADFYRRFGEPRPRVPFSQPLPETSTEGVEGPEPTGPRTQRGPQDPMALPAGVSPLPRTASGRISTKIPTTVGKTVRSKVESAVPTLPRSTTPARTEPAEWVAPEPLPVGTKPKSTTPTPNEVLESLGMPRSTLETPLPYPGAEPAAPAAAPAAPAPPTPAAPGSVMEQMLAVWMENNRLQAEYNRMLGQWIMQVNQGRIPPGSPPPPPPAPATAPGVPPAPAAPVPTAAAPAAAPKVPAAAPPVADAALEADVMDVLNSNPSSELTAGEAQMAGRRGAKGAPGERPYRTVQERDAYYAQLAAEKRTLKERARVPKRGPHMVTVREIGKDGNIIEKQVDISKVEADANVKMVPGTPTPPPKHVEPKTMEEFNDALVKAESEQGPQVYVELKAIGRTRGLRGWVRSRILNDRNQPTNFYEFLPDIPGAEFRAIKLDDIMFTGKQASHSMNIPRYGTRTYDMGIIGTATRRPNLIRGERVEFPDGKLGTIVDKTDYASLKEFVQKIRTRIKEAQDSGNTELAEQLSTFHDLLYERMSNAVKEQAAARGEGEYASDVNDTIIDLAGKYKGKLTAKLVAMDSGPWVLAEPTEFKVVKEMAPSKKTASKKITKQTKAARKDVEKRMKEAGSDRAKPDVPIHERTAGQGITAEAIAKATGRKRRDPFLTYQGLSKEQLKSRIASSNKEGKELMKEAAAKESTQPQEAAALKQKARELSLDIKDMKKVLETAPSHAEVKAREVREAAAAAEARSKKLPGAFETTKATQIPPPPGSRMSAEEYRARAATEIKLSPEEARKVIEALRKKGK